MSQTDVSTSVTGSAHWANLGRMASMAFSSMPSSAIWRHRLSAVVLSMPQSSWAHDDDVALDVQFVDGDHEAADDAVKVFKGRIAGDFDDFGIPADEAQ